MGVGVERRALARHEIELQLGVHMPQDRASTGYHTQSERLVVLFLVLIPHMRLNHIASPRSRPG